MGQGDFFNSICERIGQKQLTLNHVSDLGKDNAKTELRKMFRSTWDMLLFNESFNSLASRFSLSGGLEPEGNGMKLSISCDLSWPLDVFMTCDDIEWYVMIDNSYNTVFKFLSKLKTLQSRLTKRIKSLPTSIHLIKSRMLLFMDSLYAFIQV